MGECEGGDISYRDMVVREQPSPVQDFYNDSTIFVTGATGFMGKVLIEKLLRSCPGVKKIFILARPKKGKEIMERFKEQFADPLYVRLKTEIPNFMDKLDIVSGDVANIRLGLSDEDFERITKEVTVIFHGAATVRFDERMKHAVLVNVRGTREVIRLAAKSSKLRVLVHVSTAYSNCVVKEINEKFYDPPIQADKIIQLAETLDEELLHNMTPVLLGHFPNTYAYTKVIAENAVKEMGKGLPVIVVRPAIIVATAKEPVQGWIDNLYGPTGVVFGAAIGLLRTLHCDPNVHADIVPVDYVVNMTIVAAYDTGKNHDSPNKETPMSRENGWEEYGTKPDEREIPIYNYISSTQRPIKWDRFMKLIKMYGYDVPSRLSIWHYVFYLNKHQSINTLFMFWLHLVPAYIVDGIAYCIGKKPMLIKAYQKIHKFSAVISYFCTQQWRFYNRNTQELSKSLTPGDEELFHFDISSLNWEDFLYTYTRGIRVYILKDPLDTIAEGKKRHNLLRAAHYTLVGVLSLGLMRLVWWMLTMFNVV